MTRKKRSSMARFPWPSPGDFVSCSSSSLYSSKKSVHLITSIVTKCFSKALYPPTHYPLNQHCHLTSLSQKFRSPQSMLQLVYSFLIQNTTDFSLCSNSISRHLIQLLVMSLTACADLLETDNRIIAQSNCSNISTWKLQGCVWNSQFKVAPLSNTQPGPYIPELGKLWQPLVLQCATQQAGLHTFMWGQY